MSKMIYSEHYLFTLNDRETKQKNFVFYELNTSVVEEVMLWLSGLKESDSGKVEEK